MKQERFHDNWNQYKKRDPYERQQGVHTDRRSVSLDSEFKHKNETELYNHFSERKYVEYKENLQFHPKDPYVHKYDSRNPVYMENKPNSTNGCYRYHFHDGYDTSSNHIPNMSYEFSYNENPYIRAEEHINNNGSYNLLLVKSSETEHLNCSEKKQAPTKTSEISQISNEKMDISANQDCEIQNTSSIYNKKNDSPEQIKTISTSTNGNLTHLNDFIHTSYDFKMCFNSAAISPKDSNTQVKDETVKQTEVVDQPFKNDISIPEISTEADSNNMPSSENNTNILNFESNGTESSSSLENTNDPNGNVKVASEEVDVKVTTIRKRGRRKKVSLDIENYKKGSTEMESVHLKLNDIFNTSLNRNTSNVMSKKIVDKVPELSEQKELRHKIEDMSCNVDQSLSSNDVSNKKEKGVDDIGSLEGKFKTNEVIDPQINKINDLINNSSENISLYSEEKYKCSTDPEEYVTPVTADFSDKSNEEYKNKKYTQPVKETRRRAGRKPKIITDVMNLNRKITRNTQSFYESQLKLAIEMSIKDYKIKSIENEELDFKKEDIESLTETSDSDSDYEDKRLRRIHKDKHRKGTKRRNKLGRVTQNKKVNKTKRRVEEHNEIHAINNMEVSENIAINKAESEDNDNSQIVLELLKSEESNRSTPVIASFNEKELKTSDSSLMSAVKEFKLSESENINEQMLMQMKMRAFEEYLSMSERLYCGKTLVDDYIVYTYNGAATGMNTTTHSNQCSQKDTFKNVDKNGDLIVNGGNATETISSGNEGGSQQNKQSTNQHNKNGCNFNNKENVVSISRDPRLIMGKDSHMLPTKDSLLLTTRDNKNNGKEDKLFRFNCSRLDLMYRVSFNILKSSHRQPQVIDLWGPKELVLFELGLFKYGKEFHEIQRDIPSKSVKEIVDMYYLWKKSSRYKLWKANRYY